MTPHRRLCLTLIGSLVGGAVGLAVQQPPIKLPSAEVIAPPESGKIIADRMATPHDHEISLGDLRRGGFKNSFATPDGIELNGNYVMFLRQTAPSAKMRLRTKGKRDPVVVMVDGQAVAIMMPLAPVSK